MLSWFNSGGLGLNFGRKWFIFIIISDCWLREENDLVLEIDVYKSHTINRVSRIGGGLKIFHL